MNKYTFTVELVDNEVDELTVCGMLKAAINSIAKYDCVSHTGTKALSTQGLKVWAKRKCNVSLAEPKPAKAEKNVQVTA
tara:strand:+ start:328 stop:564 length:237 start_codon:yes stop_codon:yes gene_type:complete